MMTDKLKAGDRVRAITHGFRFECGDTGVVQFTSAGALVPYAGVKFDNGYTGTVLLKALEWVASPAPEPAPATDAANTVEVLPELTARHKDAILGLGDFGSIHIQHSMIEHQIARDLIKMGYMLFDEVTAHYYLTPAGKTLYGQLPCQNPFNPKYVPPAQNDSPDWKERAERAEVALADVGTQLEIADTRNTDLVLALERAEAALAELLARVDAVEKTAVNALENYDEYGYEQLAQSAVSAHVCKLIRGAKPGGEGGAV